MRTLLLAAGILCLSVFNNASAQKITRVNKAAAEKMQAHYGKTELLKISRADLDAIVNASGGMKAANDTFVFFLVKIGEEDIDRYVSKFKNDDDRMTVKDALQKTVHQKRPTTALVGFIPGNEISPVKHLTLRPFRSSIPVYDVAVVCPPPPDCNCEIE